MIAVYIAGKLNDDACGYLQNVHRMIDRACQVRNLQLAVYCPAEDLLSGVFHGGMSYEQYAENSMEWLRRSDMVLLTHGWEDSKGTANEIEEAKKLGIPVFEDIDRMMLYVRAIEDIPVDYYRNTGVDCEGLLNRLWIQYCWVLRELSSNAKPDQRYILEATGEVNRLVREIKAVIG